MRSPEQEQQVVMGLYGRYCIRCHGVDGRGVWDIPGIPDFSNHGWQASRPDPALVRSHDSYGFASRSNTRMAVSRRNLGHTWSRNGTSGISVKMRSRLKPIG